MRDRRIVQLLVVGCVLAHGSWTTASGHQLFEGDLAQEVAATEPLSSDSPTVGPDGASVRFEPLERDGLVALEVPTPSLRQAAGTAQPPPEPRHSGLSAIVRGTASDFAAFPRRTSTWVILGIGGAAAGIAYPFDDELNENLQDADALQKVLSPGKYMGYAWMQGSIAVGLYVIGRYVMPQGDAGRTNKVSHLGFDLLRANLVTQALTYGIKGIVRRDRPTGECCAFPSGHASVTFATAAVLERHFGYRASWPMFAIAGYVAASRLTDNRHFLSDVVFGSALGMASGWTVVGRHGGDNFTLFPVPVRGGMMLTAMWSPTRSRPITN